MVERNPLLNLYTLPTPNELLKTLLEHKYRTITQDSETRVSRLI